MANETSVFTPNRRKFPRKTFRKSIGVLCRGQGEVSEGVEIGEGGISFRSQRELALGEKVIVSFFLPEGDFFSLQTTLRNMQNLNNKKSSEKIYGVSFDEVSIPLKRQVRAYVARTLSSVSSASQGTPQNRLF